MGPRGLRSIRIFTRKETFINYLHLFFIINSFLIEHIGKAWCYITYLQTTENPIVLTRTQPINLATSTVVHYNRRCNRYYFFLPCWRKIYLGMSRLQALQNLPRRMRSCEVEACVVAQLCTSRRVRR